ncbi:Protein PYR1-3 [Includes: Glutamine-dependent carbamoyl-phosphate synthase [Durusdinium trenchii]|uniref:aspartate carbamoyltransferase n=1 Tax=Durusdinium trenchii TaxID=1381693 RepID=A0ABP0HCH7_9DINO
MAMELATEEWKGSHVLSVSDFSVESVAELFAAADKCKAAVNGAEGSDPAVLQVCKNKVLGLVFYEPSTRTNCSFAAAMQRLGGTCLQVSENSSVKKGETLQDTMRCIECYCDLTVLRHPEKGSVSRVSAYLRKPVLNAGDGDGEHPTQALLDLFTIANEQGGKIEGLTITMLGDLKYGRTTHSLAKLLAMYRVKLNFVSPQGLGMPESVKKSVAALGRAEVFECSDLQEVVAKSDVLYVTRVQKERFQDLAEYERVQGSFVVDSKALDNAMSTCTVMHPLPRVGEIAEEVDDYPNAAYFRQMENGMYVRMAIIAKVLGVL